MDLLVTDGSSSQISDKIKDVLFVRSYREYRKQSDQMSRSIFDSDVNLDTEEGGEVEFESDVSVETEEE